MRREHIETVEKRRTFIHKETAGAGAIVDIGHVIDVMATCVDIAGAKYPSSYNGRKVLPPEGKSLLPIFKGKQREGHESVCIGIRLAFGALSGRGSGNSSLPTIGKIIIPGVP